MNYILIALTFYFMSFLSQPLKLYTSKINDWDSIPVTAKVSDTLSLVDWNVNNRFTLETDRGIKSIIGLKGINLAKHLNAFTPCLLSSNRREFLEIRMIRIGDLKSMSFEAGYTKESKNRDNYLTHFSYFFTDRGIKLGITENEFLRKTKSLVYKTRVEGKIKKYRFTSKTILKELTNFGEYDSEFLFENNRLVRWRFGLIPFIPWPKN